MINFTYYAPTKVLFGKDTETETGRLLKEAGASKVLVHYGGGSVIRNGLLDRVKTSMEEAGIDYVLLGGVKPNPRLSLVYDGIELSKNEGVDFILAVGGGSVIDSAKAIALGIRNDEDVWDFYEGKRTAKNCAPVGTILTIAAAGSEMSNGSVITKEDGWLKRPYGNNSMRPVFSILNPEITYTLPSYQTSCGAVDMMMHTMERYFTTEEAMEITDGLASAVIKNVMNNASVALKNPKNYEARAELMWTSSIAHNDITGCGGIGDWSTHNIEHELGGMFDIAHGAGLAAVWSSWARYVYKTKPSRFAKFAKDIFNIDDNDEDAAALAGIEAMEEFFHSIDMPSSIGEMNINLTDDQIEELADKGTNGGTDSMGNFRKLYKQDLVEIFRMAR